MADVTREPIPVAAEQERIEQLRERLMPKLDVLPWHQRLRVYAAKDYDWGLDTYIERLEAEVLALQDRLHTQASDEGGE